jgi:hypothetical protein
MALMLKYRLQTERETPQIAHGFFILSLDGVDIDGVPIGNRIYCTLMQLLTALHKSL